MRNRLNANIAMAVVSLIGLFLLFFFQIKFAYSSLSALPDFYGGLIPCGGGEGQNPCTLSCFYVLIDNGIKFLLEYLVIPLAAIAFVIAGLLFVLGASENNITRARAIFKDTVIGLILIFGAWLIIDFILGNLLKDDYKPWNRFPTEACGQTIATPEAAGGIGSFGYNSAIDDQVGKSDLNGVDLVRVKAIIQAESGGDPKVVTTDSDGKQSYGLMQIRADTARQYNASLRGQTDKQVGAFLVEYPRYNIDIGTKYYSDLLKRYNGDTTLASAAYNGGPKANEPSANCPGLRSWQCEYDNDAHTLLNERPGHPGYGPTRRYVENVDRIQSLLK